MIEIQTAHPYIRRISQSLGNRSNLLALCAFLVLCNARQQEHSSKSSLMTIEFNRTISTMENKVPLIPAASWSHWILSQAGLVQVSVWIEAGRALELAAPMLKWNHTLLPVQLLLTAGAHKALGAHRHPYQHLELLLPPFGRSTSYTQVLYAAKGCQEAQCSQAIQGCWAIMFPILGFCSGTFGSHQGARPDITLAGNSETGQPPQQCSPTARAGFTSSSGDLSHPEQREKNRESLITTALSFNLNKCSLTWALP